MGELLGLGITHYPNLAFTGELTVRTKRRLTEASLPDALRDPANWPEPMRREWGNDDGAAHSEAHRAAMIEQFRHARQVLDEFKPDLCVIWGDDQYEVFREDCVPAFCVLAYDKVDVQPWAHAGRGQNAWHEPADQTFTIQGHRPAGKQLVTSLLGEGFDVAYSYKPLHTGLGHAFTNSVLYLDWERRGFPYPVLPFSVNCYGRSLLGPRVPELANGADEDRLDPPSPSPNRCFQVGAAVARAFAASPWRVALIASSSWSHSFLTAKHAGLYPDGEADRRYFAALQAGDWDLWRNTTLAQAEDRGHHELLNWFCLAGAMAELNRKPDEAVFLESWITNSNKTFAVFRP